MNCLTTCVEIRNSNNNYILLAESFYYSSFQSVIVTAINITHISHSRYCGKLKSGPLAQLCLQIIFFIAILEGEPRRFEPRPDLEVSKQTQLKLSYFFAITCTILNCVVVIMLNTCADRPGSNPYVATNFIYPFFAYFTVVNINCITFFLKLYINWQNYWRVLNGKVLKIRNHQTVA